MTPISISNPVSARAGRDAPRRNLSKSRCRRPASYGLLRSPLRGRWITVAPVRRVDDARVTVGGMRFAALFAVAACGQPAPATTTPAHPTPFTHVAAREPIDVLAALGDA